MVAFAVSIRAAEISNTCPIVIPIWDKPWRLMMVPQHSSRIWSWVKMSWWRFGFFPKIGWRRGWLVKYVYNKCEHKSVEFLSPLCSEMWYHLCPFRITVMHPLPARIWSGKSAKEVPVAKPQSTHCFFGVPTSFLHEFFSCQAVIGCMGDVDSYLLPDAKGYQAMLRHLLGEDDEYRQKVRDQHLALMSGRAWLDWLDWLDWLGGVEHTGQGIFDRLGRFY